MSTSPRVFQAAALACVLFASTATALTVIPPDFEKLVAEADTVVDGTVGSVRSEIEHRGGRPMVYTYVTINIADTLKGAATPSVRLRILGGTAGDLTVYIPGLPRFVEGDRGIFFIVGNGVQFCPLVGIGHGHYPVLERGGNGPDVVLRHNLEPLRSVSDVSQPFDHLANLEERRRTFTGGGDAMSVSEFKQRIREEVAHAREQ